MHDRYDHKKVELRWQRLWQEQGTFKSRDDDSKEKYYVLEMFPYPSGNIHMGHVRNYAIGDVTARYQTRRGKNVLHPMGWDSFGLPAENAARERAIHPGSWTHDNIANMRRQLKRMGLSYDWELEIATCTPRYYRWNQWFFIKMLEKGLAYKKRSSVNWCPDCETVLANEQVEDDRCWRCESLVQDKDLDQWFLKTTEYVEELLAGTYNLPGWPEMVLTSQRNWIGKSEGAEVDFIIEATGEKLTVFTTRPDTLYGTTFMSLAIEHPLVQSLTSEGQETAVKVFIDKIKKERAVKDISRDPASLVKQGVFTGAYCKNPLTGARMPIYIANFVLMGYGTGAVMAVPAHDQRDFEFAREYGLDIKVVINPADTQLDASLMQEAYTEDGIMTASGGFDGLPSTQARGKITELLEEKGFGKKAVTYKLRDWGISRQRYWGCPIPVVYCDNGCGTLPVPLDTLPVLLPEDVDFSATGARSPLATSEEFLSTVCPKCAGPARRETDTMDTFVDSSWYFLRYLSPDKETGPVDTAKANYWLPVDRYIGGVEHAVMHLLYARFFTKVIRDLGLIDFGEPFKNLLTQGMVCKETIRCDEHGYLAPDESDAGNMCKKCGLKATVGRVEKMSKSKKNVIDPNRIVERYGADTARLFTLFASPPTKDLDWNEDGVEGAYRFLKRVWTLVAEFFAGTLADCEAYAGAGGLTDAQKSLHRKTHETIRKVTIDIEERFHFNTAISAIMELVNKLYHFRAQKASIEDPVSASVFKEGLVAVISLLNPFAPHITEELWASFGNDELLSSCAWLQSDPDAIRVDVVEVVVQVNGKVRSKITLDTTATERTAEAMVLADPKVLKWIEDKEVRKFIYIPGKIANLVVS